MTANTDAMDEFEDLLEQDRRLAATLRRMRNQPSLPSGVTQDELRDVMERGFMTYISGRLRGGFYMVTDAGHEFLREH